ncbi:hypothetical protein QKV40_gp14 [Varidnaviria sp.]|uniref:Uncharacterized protein n=1 Tax=Lokiarchaeia virus SkuldV1 TaxID=3058189 RepID=A0AA46RHV8_9VIRU|nr:hypothetical protein QKV40_gp14 [Varidnaviria sp.]UPO70968.1 hypothetical protein 11324_00014 [Lokiarchaeia virus SkuldV1]
MSWEIGTRKVKKGFVYAITDIPISETLNPPLLNFLPKTITKIILTVQLTAGNSMTITINGVYSFEVGGLVSFEIYSNEFTANEVVEIPGCNFHRYDYFIETDASTTGRVHTFFEYDYDLIK